ncbi:nuclear transport factor 2 family protein [Aliikangiella coralliicola]|uniref:Nuclear transport factor 2 family protein n=1 Tax=Aliikangiella coralliicola TaxID=2592383 RepID=A0A545UJV6_9GAMM|nr:nuclear transport factor 2 family protein [Aliikangiella coralliicola]TQV89749.1 nuclear transport factor 2 family protein [Aliikangiella coralliicola]
MTIQNANQFIADLYKNIDQKNINFLDKTLGENVRFRLGNGEGIVGKDAVLAANAGFFVSITSMHHTITGAWNIGDTIICHGEVNYVRLDGSQYSAYFSTFLVFEGNMITDYLVFADLSEL